MVFKLIDVSASADWCGIFEQCLCVSVPMFLTTTLILPPWSEDDHVSCAQQVLVIEQQQVYRNRIAKLTNKVRGRVPLILFLFISPLRLWCILPSISIWISSNDDKWAINQQVFHFHSAWKRMLLSLAEFFSSSNQQRKMMNWKQRQIIGLVFCSILPFSLKLQL